jgi:hypothetical protein
MAEKQRPEIWKAIVTSEVLCGHGLENCKGKNTDAGPITSCHVGALLEALQQRLAQKEMERQEAANRERSLNSALISGLNEIIEGLQREKKDLEAELKSLQAEFESVKGQSAH